MKYIKINPDDNVAVALQDLQAGEVVEGVKLLCDIPRGHKIVLRDLAEGQNVIKYGFPHRPRDPQCSRRHDGGPLLRQDQPRRPAGL